MYGEKIDRTKIPNDTGDRRGGERHLTNDKAYDGGQRMNDECKDILRSGGERDCGNYKGGDPGRRMNQR